MSLTLGKRDARSRTQLGSGPSMTPMVDVVLVILVFFMASAAFMGPEWLLGIALPEQETGQGEADPFAIPAPRFVIEIDTDAGGSAIFSGLGLDDAPIESLGGQVAKLLETVASEDLVLILQPSDGAAYEAVVRAREVCEQAGATRIGLR